MSHRNWRRSVIRAVTLCGMNSAARRPNVSRVFTIEDALGSSQLFFVIKFIAESASEL